MKLHTTLDRFGDRDSVIFPALDRMSRQNGNVPSFYQIQAGRSVCRLLVDDFYVPPEVQERLEALYDAYVAWWMAPGNPARTRTSRGTNYGFYYIVDIAVLTEHASWWIELLNECGAFTYNPWQDSDPEAEPQACGDESSSINCPQPEKE